MTYENIITVTEFGEFAPEVDTSQYTNPTISGMISQASRMATDYLEYSPLAENIVDEVKQGLVTVDGDLLIMPAKLPIVSVSALYVTKGTTTLTVELQRDGTDKFNIDYTRRHIRLPYNELILQGTTVVFDFYALRSSQFYTKMSYRGGWEPSELPATIKQAVVLLTKDILSGQNNAMGLTSMSQGQVRFSWGKDASGVSPLVKQAHLLLGPYRRLG